MSRVIGIALTCLAAAAFGSLRPDDNSPDGIWISRSAVSNLPVVGPAWEQLIAHLTRIGLSATADDGVVEVTVAGDGELDQLRDAVADLGLPLYRLSTRLTSLDEVFLRLAGSST